MYFYHRSIHPHMVFTFILRLSAHPFSGLVSEAAFPPIMFIPTFWRCWYIPIRFLSVTYFFVIVCTLYGPNLVGKLRDVFWRSYSCDLTPHGTSTPRPHIGRIQNSRPCQEYKRLEPPVPRHIFGMAGYHQFFTTKILRRLSMLQCV